MASDWRPSRAAIAQEVEARVATLIVGGDSAARRELQAQVVALGYACDEVPDTAAALQWVEQRPYDAVLADLDSLPRQELAAHLAALHGGPGEPALIAMTHPDKADLAVLAWDAGAQGLLRKPPLPAELRFALRCALESRRLALEQRNLSRRIQKEVLKQTKELLDTIQRLERVEMGVRRSQEETIHRLSLAAEYRDNETGRHLQRMSQYSALLARRFGLSHERAEAIRTASPMHDVGKIGISDSILYKKGRHTPAEFEIMKQHAQFGYEILRGSKSELLDTAATIAWTHHERYDGSGYPRGLKEREIPLEGRIVAIADTFDALTSKRVYKPAFTLEQTTQLMIDGRGKHFDPELLDLFWEGLDEALEIKSRYSDAESADETPAAKGGEAS